MADKEFNLLDENWVRVITPECEIKEVSLTDAIVHSHEYSGLCGELPTQDVAVMRLLLAVLHTVFSRVNEDGEPAPLEDPDEALERWKIIWDMGHIPEKPVRDYLESQHEKFWLFHPERPFYQVPEAKIGTEYGAAKLNGELSESSNKLRLFTTYSGEKKSKLPYSEAARWLLYVNAYDDTSAKPKGKNLPSPGAGWLGKLGLITAEGRNLFETLMLNFVMLKDGNELWGEEKPAWELEKAKAAERSEIALPDNPAELYTLQSRRLLLIGKDGMVTGYYLLGGDFFNKEMAFAEQMTIWSPIRATTKDKSVIGFKPCRHDSSKQMWREFPTAFPAEEKGEKHTPGIVSWVSKLKAYELLDDEQLIKFCTSSAQYGDKDFFISDVFSDSLSFHKKLLEEANDGWRSAIADEVAKCDQLATAVYYLAKDLDSAMGESEGKSYKAAKEQLYFRIDVPFRNWLESIDSEWGTDKAEEDRERWRKTAQKIAVALGEEMVVNAGEDAFTGRIIKEEGKSAKFYSSSKALLDFKYNVREIYN